MEFEVVELLEHDDEIVMDRLQLSPVAAGPRLLGFHTSPQSGSPNISQKTVRQNDKVAAEK
jgi:hypothetical protein